MRMGLFLLPLVICIAAATQRHASVASAGASFIDNRLDPPGQQQQLATNEVKLLSRRMYAMCPPRFHRIGTECFSLPAYRLNWLNAYFYCKDQHAKLAEPKKFLNRKLRNFMQQHDTPVGTDDPIWFGATFDWVNRVWQYGISNKNLTSAASSQMDPQSGRDLGYTCAVFDPKLKYRWSTRLCSDKHRFICQHKMPKVSEKNRHRVYNRWNVTFPNEYANEVILEVIDRRDEKNFRINRRVKAEDSNEEIILTSAHPPRSNRRPYPHQRPRSQRKNPQTRPHTHLPPTVSLPTRSPSKKIHWNEVNYPYQSNTSRSPSWNANTLHPLPNDAWRKRRTEQDLKLQRQREKERGLLQRKKKRREHKRKEKPEHAPELFRHREEQQSPKVVIQKQQQRNWDMDELRQREKTETKITSKNEATLLMGTEEKKENALLEKDRIESEKQRQLEILRQQAEAKRRSWEYETEERRRAERRMEEHRLNEEKEKRLQQARDEHERRQHEEEERQRHREQENQRLLEAEEQARNKELEKIVEEKRQRENRKRIIQAPEEHPHNKQAEESEVQQGRSKVESMKLEEAEQRKNEEQHRQRSLQRIQELKRNQDYEHNIQEEKKRKYAERLSKLSPEDQKKFFESRKQRKMLRNKLQ